MIRNTKETASRTVKTNECDVNCTDESEGHMATRQRKDQNSVRTSIRPFGTFAINVTDFAHIPEQVRRAIDEIDPGYSE